MCCRSFDFRRPQEGLRRPLPCAGRARLSRPIQVLYRVNQCVHVHLTHALFDTVCALGLGAAPRCLPPRCLAARTLQFECVNKLPEILPSERAQDFALLGGNGEHYRLGRHGAGGPRRRPGQAVAAGAGRRRDYSHRPCCRCPLRAPPSTAAGGAIHAVLILFSATASRMVLAGRAD